MKNKYINIYQFYEKRKIRFMENQLFFKSLIATSPKRIQKCRTVSKAPENCAKMPKSRKERAFGSTSPFVRLDERMGQRNFSSERQRPRRVALSKSSCPLQGSAWTEPPTPLWKHCQKEQFKAEGLFRLMKDISLWIAAAYKKLSPGPFFGPGVHPLGPSIKALETLRDSVINGRKPTGLHWRPKGGEFLGTGGKAAAQGPAVAGPKETELEKGLTQKEDKERSLVQEVIRSILETVYEPVFLSCSHGFRPGRSQHTCLKQIRRDFVGTVWFVSGAPAKRRPQCFNKIDKQVLIGLMRRRIRDNRFLNLVQKELETSNKAKGAEGPKGPWAAKGAEGLLCNIVLHELDLFVMRLKRIVDRGRRGVRRAAAALESKARSGSKSAALTGRTPAHRAKVTTLSSGSSSFGSSGSGLGSGGALRINYVRFADDFLIGVIGPRALAERIRGLVTRFISVRLKLKLNLPTTLPPKQSSRPNTLPAHYVAVGRRPSETGFFFSILHSNNFFPISAHGEKRKKQIFCIRGGAKKIAFLGYLISRDSTYLRRGRRYGIRRSGGLSLLVDMRKVINRLAEKGFCDKSGNPKPNFAYFQYPQTYSVARIASILRGLANYYHLANSKRRCVARLSYILRTSLAKTYAAKFKLGTAAKVFAKGGRDLSKPIKARKGLNNAPRVSNRRGQGVNATSCQPFPTRDMVK